MKYYLFVFSLFLLSGCGSIAKGVTEAVLEQQDENIKECNITGSEFYGVQQSLNSQKDNPAKKTKMLVVHGISPHVPGYSAEFKKKLVSKLNLKIVSDGFKEIEIQHPNYKNKYNEPENLGVLRVSRHQNVEGTQDFLFYELTWSSIADAERADLQFDSSGEFSYRRAGLNRTMKTFLNETVPDLMVYRGNSKSKINDSVSQAVCWTFSGDWDSLPDKGAHFCNARAHDFSENILVDDYFFVTHSLGSRITIDTISQTAVISDQIEKGDVNRTKLANALKEKDFHVYMLSNQLPLLQLGIDKPEIHGQESLYCEEGSAQKNNRIFKAINLIAFSDPNDILSYPIPENYADENLDSRLCANIVNVDINVANINQALGIGFANPLEAHGNYWQDDRVIALIKNGVSRKNMSPFIKDKCKWTEAVK